MREKGQNERHEKEEKQSETERMTGREIIGEREKDQENREKGKDKMKEGERE